MKKIIIINGTGGVGKDTFVNFCADYCQAINYSSVQEVKEIAHKVGWDGVSKTDKDRKFLAELKILLANYNDFPMKCIKKQIENFYKSDKEILFIHIRNIDEIERIVKEYKNVFTLLITNSKKPINISNFADAQVLNYNYDVVIENGSTLKDLKRSAKDFVMIMRMTAEEMV